MNSREGRGKMRLMRMLHVLMISLSFLASIALYMVPSVTTKLVISILLIAYTITIIMKSESIRNIFKISVSQAEQNYQNLRKWEIEKNIVEVKSKNKEKVIEHDSNFLSKRSRSQTEYNTSQMNSYEKSMDIRNISMSIQRSLNFSNLNDTRLQRLNQRGIKQFNGPDLSDLFAGDDVNNAGSVLRKNKETGLVLIDNQTYLNNNTMRFMQNASKEYEKVLKTVIRKQKKDMEKKYSQMMQMLKKTVKILLTDHNDLKQKLIKLGQQHFEIKIVQSQKTINQQLNMVNLKSNQPKKCSFQLFLYKMLLLHSNKITVNELGFDLKKEFKWAMSVYPKITQLSFMLFKISESLGVDSLLLKSKLQENTQKFIEDYRKYIQMAQLYLQQQSSKNNPQSKETSFYSQLAKSRAFALYMIVKEINASLKYQGKIRFNDSLNFRYPQENKIQFQINKREGTEGPYIHYDLVILGEGIQKMKHCCQPGERNYLSVLYLLFLQLSKKEDLLSWNTYMKKLVTQYV